MSYTLAEGYKAFRLQTTNTSGNNTLKFTLRDYNNTPIHSSQEHIQVVDDIQVRVTPV